MSSKKISHAHAAFEAIRKIDKNASAEIGIVLGSGLGGFADVIENPRIIPYTALPGFPKPTVAGHEGKLILGEISGKKIACLQGRTHAYEGQSGDAVKTYVRTLRLLGAHTFIATNAAGSLNVEMEPGTLMLVSDHINLQPSNPLVGENDDDFGPRFYPLDKAYDLSLREKFLALAKKEGIPLHEGVYISVIGPHYETAAEIRAFKIMGADAVGMSTVPEVLTATHCGMKVAVLSVMTNYATGIAKTSHSHEAVLETAREASRNLIHLMKEFIKS